MAQNTCFFFRTFLIVLSLLILFGKVTANVKQCGTLKIEQPTLLGRNVTVTFTPETTSDADLKWQRAKEGNPWSPLPNNNKFTQYFQDGTYYLILTDTVSYGDEVRYSVDYRNKSVNCSMETPKLQLQVAPSAPVFEGLKDIDDCKGCIVGEDGDQFDVLCKTSGGTKPITVTMSIGNESLSTVRYNDKAGYIPFSFLRNRHHMANMTCTVMNDALISPFIITARVYVIKSPTFHLFMVPGVLKEGETVNITCVVKNGRPAPKVHIDVSGTEVTSAVQTDYFSSSTSLNTNAVSLTKFEPIWNRENITCCRYSEWYKITRECSPPKQVNFLYAPVEFNISGSVLNISEEEQAYVKCSVKSLRTFNLSRVEHTDDGNIYQKHCLMKTDCVIVIDAYRISQRHLNCQASSLQTTDKKTLTVNIYEKAKQRFNIQDTSGYGGNSFIWIIISSCLTAVLIGVFIACLVAIKKLKTAKAQSEANQVRHRGNVGGTRNDVELEYRVYENSSTNDVELEDRAYENSSRNDVELEDRAYEKLNDTRYATGQSETLYSQLSS